MIPLFANDLLIAQSDITVVTSMKRALAERIVATENIV